MSLSFLGGYAIRDTANFREETDFIKWLRMDPQAKRLSLRQSRSRHNANIKVPYYVAALDEGSLVTV